MNPNRTQCYCDNPVSHYMQMLLPLIVLSLLFTSCGRRDDKTISSKKTLNGPIDFFDSKEAADAYAALPKYKEALRAGDFVAANGIACSVDFKKAIPEYQITYLHILSTCTECVSGECKRCNNSGICGMCDPPGYCSACKGQPERRIQCTTCICRYCGGNGVCRSCSGYRQLQCASCRGTGWGNGSEVKTCDQCGGRGKVAYQITRGAHPCQRCNGSGKIQGSRNKCQTCSGTGRQNCNQCKGSSRCTHCNGKGRNSSCDICGGKREVVYTCKSCNESGRCPICAGKNVCQLCQGKMLCTICNRLGVLQKFTLICDKSWLTRSSGIFSDANILVDYLSATTITINNRIITMPNQLSNGVAIIAMPDKYQNAAKLVFIKE